MGACFRGQANGLLGAAEAGVLFVVTGLHTGHVNFRVDAEAAEPPFDIEWEECVEVSFSPGPKPRLVDWNGAAYCDIPVRGSQRVRFYADGMDRGRAKDTAVGDDLAVDRYKLVFWPAPRAEDKVVRQTSSTAVYWHQSAPAMSR